MLGFHFVTQGYDSACMAIYLATGRNSGATLSVFAKWAACTGVFMFQVAEGEHQAACEKVGEGSREPIKIPTFWAGRT